MMINSTWLTPQLKKQLRLIFEPRYGRSLEDGEVVEIANNLADFMELLINYRMEKYEKK